MTGRRTHSKVAFGGYSSLSLMEREYFQVPCRFMSQILLGLGAEGAPRVAAPNRPGMKTEDSKSCVASLRLALQEVGYLHFMDSLGAPFRATQGLPSYFWLFLVFHHCLEHGLGNENSGTSLTSVPLQKVPCRHRVVSSKLVWYMAYGIRYINIWYILALQGGYHIMTLGPMSVP